MVLYCELWLNRHDRARSILCLKPDLNNAWMFPYVIP